MDDLKVILYIVIAIVWVVYNNYKKIKNTGRQRDLSKAPGEVIQENWPDRSSNVPAPIPQTRQEVVEEQRDRPSRMPLERLPLPKRKTIKKAPLKRRTSTFFEDSIHTEGGLQNLNEIVYFEDVEEGGNDTNSYLNYFHNTDLKHGIVMAEILKRPYN